MLQANQTQVRFDIGDNLNQKFDLIENCEVYSGNTNYKNITDQFVYLKERRGTVRSGDTHSTTIDTGINTAENPIINYQTFFTGQDENRYHYKTYAGKVFKLVGSTWTDIGFTSPNNTDHLVINTIKLPAGNPTASRTSSATATGIEKIKNDTVNDSTPTNNIGKYIMIVGESSPSQVQYNTTDVYRNKYAYIASYDTVNSEYLLEGLGNAEAIQSGAKYKIFDKLDTYLQIVNLTTFNDRYYTGTAFETTFEGRLRQHFERAFAGYQNLETAKIRIKKVFNYDGLLWLQSKATLFRSEAKNYLWFNILDVIDHGDFDDINESFVWNNKLIVGGKRSIRLYKKDSTLNTYVSDEVSANYGIKIGGVNNFDKDVLLYTTNNKIINLSENIYGIVLPKNFGQPVQKYLDTKLVYNIASGFDGRYFYLYGSDNGYTTGVGYTAGTTLVYDTQYSFWSIFSGIQPSQFLLEGNTFYITSVSSNKVFYFDNTGGDDGVVFTQKVVTKRIDLDEPFRMKEIVDFYAEFENRTQDMDVKILQELSNTSYQYTVNLPITQITNSATCVRQETLPRIRRQQFAKDGGLRFQIEIQNKNSLYFVLKEMAMVLESKNTDYVNPNVTY